MDAFKDPNAPGEMCDTRMEDLVYDFVSLCDVMLAYAPEVKPSIVAVARGLHSKVEYKSDQERRMALTSIVEGLGIADCDSVDAKAIRDELQRCVQSIEDGLLAVMSDMTDPTVGEVIQKVCDHPGSKDLDAAAVLANVEKRAREQGLVDAAARPASLDDHFDWGALQRLRRASP